MSVTINGFMTKDHDFTFYKEEEELVVTRIEFYPDKSNRNQNKENTKKFVSDDKKILMHVPSSPYHFVHDFLGQFMNISNLFPELLFIFNVTEYDDPLYANSTIFPFFKKMLNDKNIKHELITNKDDEFIIANNFYLLERYTDAHNISRKILDFLSLYIKDKDVKPFRKVYISRRYMNMHQRSYPEFIDNGRVSRDKDLRIDKEAQLEDFFRSRGYQVVAPEEFDSFEDQINFFYEVKTAVSLTSGGLVNSIFMQDGGNVIELVTPLIAQMHTMENGVLESEYEEAHHHYYSAIAFNKRHLYIGIENYSTKIKDFIDKFEKHSIIKYAIENL